MRCKVPYVGRWRGDVRVEEWKGGSSYEVGWVMCEEEELWEWERCASAGVGVLTKWDASEAAGGCGMCAWVARGRMKLG